MGSNTHNTQFHGKARAYAAARPGYPAEALNYVDALIRGIDPAPQSKTPAVADIGAGTGKFTVPLAELGTPDGLSVFAVEPDPDMRGELLARTAQLPNVTVLDGTASHTGLPGRSVDAITVAQALHWFSPADFSSECRRIARGGRYLLISLYNVTSFDSALKNAEPTSAKPTDAKPVERKLSGSIQHFRETTAAFFRHPVVREFPNPIRYTRDTWRAYMDSHSHSPLPGSPEYPVHRAWVNAVFDERAIDGILADDTVCMVASELMPA
ncbi:class I SAM-dependent methyltransferase [Bifidobacterium avesanii]|nr:class I SAM-dependent methyltransferase [Bifidobacterium avesanii]KAB8287912.1 acetyltransferase family protein [Bifidobacterium avesanii]